MLLRSLCGHSQLLLSLHFRSSHTSDGRVSFHLRALQTLTFKRHLSELMVQSVLVKILDVLEINVYEKFYKYLQLLHFLRITWPQLYLHAKARSVHAFHVLYPPHPVCCSFFGEYCLYAVQCKELTQSLMRCVTQMRHTSAIIFSDASPACK